MFKQEMDEEAPTKVRKPLDAEALAKLALAREKANAKRKELAAKRAEEKEALASGAERWTTKERARDLAKPFIFCWHYFKDLRGLTPGGIERSFNIQLMITPKTITMIVDQIARIKIYTLFTEPCSTPRQN